MHWNLFTNNYVFLLVLLINFFLYHSNKQFLFSIKGYAYPICKKSLINMTRMWCTLDLELSHTAMPEEYKEFYVLVRCFC